MAGHDGRKPISLDSAISFLALSICACTHLRSYTCTVSHTLSLPLTHMHILLHVHAPSHMHVLSHSHAHISVRDGPWHALEAGHLQSLLLEEPPLPQLCLRRGEQGVAFGISIL